MFEKIKRIIIILLVTFPITAYLILKFGYLHETHEQYLKRHQISFKFDRNFNSIRKKFGVPLIDSAFYTFDTLGTSGSSEIGYINDDIKNPKHSEKSIIIHKNGTSSEYDTYENYISDNKYYFLAMQFDFINDSFCNMESYFYVRDSARFDISTLQADSILHSWGLSRTDNK